MVEPVTLFTLILAIITPIGIFFKHIKKCSCTKTGISIERTVDGSNNPEELQNQQEFMLNLVKVIKNAKSEHGTEESNTTPADIKENMKNMLRVLEKNNKQQHSPLKRRFSAVKRSKNPTVDMEKKIEMLIQEEVTRRMEKEKSSHHHPSIKIVKSDSMDKASSSTKHHPVVFTPFIATNKPK